MRSALPLLSLLIGSTAAHPQVLSSQVLSPRDNTPAKYQNAVYWGQNGGGKEQNEDLTHYCKEDSGVDILILAFLFRFGNNGTMIPSGGFGRTCAIEADGKATEACTTLAEGIKACQAKNVKVLLAIGGTNSAENTDYSLQSEKDAKEIGKNLWEMYGKKGDGKAERPFGDVAVDGFDVNPENGEGSKYYPHLISTLRENFKKDESKTYYISAAPMCRDGGMHEIISESKFDFIWIQYYNSPDCHGDKEGEVWDDWKKISGDAKLFIGLPADPLAGTGDEVGKPYYRGPGAVNTLVKKIREKDPGVFGGTMLWAACFSDARKFEGKDGKTCTYAQMIRNILNSDNAACPTTGEATPEKPAPAKDPAPDPDSKSGNSGATSQIAAIVKNTAEALTKLKEAQAQPKRRWWSPS